MSDQQRQYWAIRTDKDCVGDLYEELKQGRLRQGWGYKPEQDLREVVPRMNEEWDQLTPEQQDVYRHRKMYQWQGKGVRIGDYILVPRMPSLGRFTLVQVTGEYRYEIFRTGDHGHVLPVELLTPDGVAHYNKHVDSGIRRTMRAQSRMWSIDGYADSIDKIVQAAQQGENILDESDAAARLKVAVESALEQARNELVRQLGPKLDEQFRAAEWEDVIIKALEQLYPGAMAEVRHTGGSGEQGIDIVLRITNHFAAGSVEVTDWMMLIQVKDYQGTMYGTGAIEQLRQGLNAYGQEGKTIALVVMTNAEQADEECVKAAKKLEKETDVPVFLVFRDELLRLIANGMV